MMIAQKNKLKQLWTIFILVVFISVAGCTAITSTSSEVKILDGWAVFQRKVRDVLILDGGIILLSNSAPQIGIGPENGKPYIMAFDLRTHKIIWKLEYAPLAPISTNSQKMFVLENDQFAAIDLEQGDEVWSIPFNAIDSPQIFSDEDLVLVANNQVLYAFDTQNGELQWTSDAQLPFDISFPNPTDFTSWRQHSALDKYGHIVFAREMITRNSKECQMLIAAVDAENGLEIWQHSFSLPVVSEGCLPGTLPLASNNEIVLIGILSGLSNECTLNAFDINTGEIVWNYTGLINCSTSSDFVFLNRQILVVTSSDILILDPRDGHLVSKLSLPLGRFHKLISTEGIIAAKASDLNQNTYQIMDLNDKKVYEFKLSLPRECDSQTEIAGIADREIIFVNGNCVQAINISDGELIAK